MRGHDAMTTRRICSSLDLQTTSAVDAASERCASNAERRGVQVDWKGLYHQIRGKSQQPAEELEGASVDALNDLKRTMRGQPREDRLFCRNGHPLFKGQRPEDCYDCYQVQQAQQERAQDLTLQQKNAVERRLSGALLCVKGFHEGMAFALRLLEDVPLYLGSDPDCDIVLSDAQISRRHLMVVLRQGRTIVRDLNSLHHSALRAKDELQWYVLDPDREYWCEDGSHLVLGDVEMLYRAVDVQALKLGGQHVLTQASPLATPLASPQASLSIGLSSAPLSLNPGE